jgi:two-component system cell cycle response regulator
MHEPNDLLSGSPEAPRVLIVEDDPVFAMLIQRLFRSQGVDSQHASDGETALRLHQENHYRMVVSDWMMPGMDGVSLCREFRQIQGPYTYFLLCSARGERDDRLEAFEAGVDDFLSKPLDKEEFQARLKVARRLLATEENLEQQKSELARIADSLSTTNASLEIASQRFRELFRGLPVACFTFGEEGRIREWNRDAESVFAIEGSQAIGGRVDDLLSPRAVRGWEDARIEYILQGEQVPDFDWTYRLPDGSLRYLACSVICLRGREGQAAEAVCANVDITERKLAERRVEEQVAQINEMMLELTQQKAALEAMNLRLSHLAVTDGLTGLWNHRRFQEMLEETMELHRRSGEPFSLILLDIDHFKLLNDAYGHQVGDQALKQFANALRSASRQHELPARYGGEEFAVLLHRCDADASLIAAERFRDRLRAEPWESRTLTASIGVATWSTPLMSSRELVAQADRALYVSKQAGRDRITHFSSVTQATGAA